MLNKKKKIYEYLDLINYSSYLLSTEKKAKSINEWSFRLLLNDFEKNINLDKCENYINFKINVEYTLGIMDRLLINNNFNKIQEYNIKLNEKFDLFIELEKKKLFEDNDKCFYDVIKNKIYNDMILLKHLNIKISNFDLPDKNIEIIYERTLRSLIVTLNNLRCFYRKNKESIKLEDHVLLNIKSSKEINNIIEFLENGNKIYNNHKLPICIKERVYNNNNISNKNISNNEVNNNFNGVNNYFYIKYEFFEIMNHFNLYKKEIYACTCKTLKLFQKTHIYNIYINIKNISWKEILSLYNLSKKMF